MHLSQINHNIISYHKKKIVNTLRTSSMDIQEEEKNPSINMWSNFFLLLKATASNIGLMVLYMLHQNE
jgi:hypothetical protein